MEYLIAGAVALVVSLFLNVCIFMPAMMARRRELYDEYGEPRSTRRKRR